MDQTSPMPFAAEDTDEEGGLEQEPTQGPSTVVDEMGGFARTYQVSGGHPEGLVEDRVGDQLVRKFTLEQGLLEGPMESYDGQGRLESLLCFKTNQLHGLCTYYTAGRVTIEMNFEEGVQQGLMKTYHENGMLQSCVMYEKGQMEGLFQVFDDRGQLVRVSPYAKGLLEGEVVTYFTDGKTLSAKQTYKANLLEGPSFTYDEKGRVLTDNMYKAGLLDGKQKTFHPPTGDQDLVISIEATYAMGICQEEKRYNEQGKTLENHEKFGQLTPAQKADRDNRKGA